MFPQLPLIISNYPSSTNLAKIHLGRSEPFFLHNQKMCSASPFPSPVHEAGKCLFHLGHDIFFTLNKPDLHIGVN